MRYREIAKWQAEQVLKILVDECGHRVIDPRDGEAFVRSISTEGKDDTGPRYVTREYRFCGALGFGGKFRNNGNKLNTPHVDCYREDETPARLQMIEAANKRLDSLFNPVSGPSFGGR